MDRLPLDALHLTLGVGFHALFASLIITMGWGLVLFAALARARPGRGWGMAFDFWCQVLTLSVALWAVSGVSLWLMPTQGADSARVSPLLLLAGAAFPAAILALLLRRRHLLGQSGLVVVSAVLAAYLMLAGLHEPPLGPMHTTDAASDGSVALSIAHSALITGNVLAGLSALRGLFHDCQPDMRLGLITGLLVMASASAVMLALWWAQGGAHMAGPLGWPGTNVALAALLLAAALGALWALRPVGQQRDRPALPQTVLIVLAGLGLAGWLVLSLAAPRPLGDAGAMSRPIDAWTFASYAALYAGLTATYLAGLVQMARARAASAAPMAVRAPKTRVDTSARTPQAWH